MTEEEIENISHLPTFQPWYPKDQTVNWSTLPWSLDGCNSLVFPYLNIYKVFTSLDYWKQFRKKKLNFIHPLHTFYLADFGFFKKKTLKPKLICIVYPLKLEHLKLKNIC
jgi:hypothetical protein